MRHLLREAGGVRPRLWRDLEGRYLSFEEREEIAIGVAAGRACERSVRVHRPATDPVGSLLDRVVDRGGDRVDGRGYLLSCLPLARRAARVLVRTLRSFAARYGPRAGRSLLAFRGL